MHLQSFSKHDELPQNQPSPATLLLIKSHLSLARPEEEIEKTS